MSAASAGTVAPAGVEAKVCTAASMVARRSVRGSPVCGTLPKGIPCSIASMTRALLEFHQR